VAQCGQLARNAPFEVAAPDFTLEASTNDDTHGHAILSATSERYFNTTSRQICSARSAI
jgi:hypothetical protein